MASSKLSSADRARVVDFLETLQLLPKGSTLVIFDEA